MTHGLLVPPFELHTPEGSEVSADGEKLQTRAGDVENVNADLSASHNTATQGVAGDLATLLTGKDEPAKREALKLVQKLTSAGGALDVLGGQITTYNETIRRFHDQIRAHEKRKDQADERGRLAGRAEDAAELLRSQATKATTALEDPLAPAVIQRLTRAGAMPGTVTALYPDAGVTAAQQAQGLEAKIEAGEVPDFSTMSPEQVDAYLEDHPELIETAAQLLAVASPSPAVLAMVQSTARLAANRTRDGLDDEPGQDALDKIAEGNELLTQINQRLADGGKLTPTEAAYINQWTNHVGATGLAALPKVVTESVQATKHNPSIQQADYDRYLRPVGDAILNYSNVDRHMPGAVDTDGNGIVSKAQMPTAVRELVEMRIGGHHERTDDEGFSDQGYRYGDPESGSFDDIMNLDRFNGWSQLMGSSSVDPGDAFAEDLGHQAIQAKQDINAIMGSASALNDHWIGPSDGSIDSDEKLEDLAERLHDRGSSSLLSVVSRNEDASSSMLLDDTDRRALLGMNWDDGSGAGDLIRSGTDRTGADPDDPNDTGGGTKQQALAAIAVMKEIASEPNAYEDRANEQVSDAVVDMGIQWVDTFGNEQRGSAPYLADGLDGTGRPLDFQLNLDEKDAQGFLRFVAGTSDGEGASRDESDPVRFQAAATAYGNTMLEHAMKHGDPEDVNDALRWMGRSDTRIDAANIDWAADEFEDTNSEKVAEVVAQNRENAANSAAAKFVTNSAATGFGAAFPPAAPFLSIAAGGMATHGYDALFPQGEVPDYDAENIDYSDQITDDSDVRAGLRLNYRLATIAAEDHADDPDYAGLYDANGELKSFQEVMNTNRAGDYSGERLLAGLANQVEVDYNRGIPAAEHVSVDDQYRSQYDEHFRSSDGDRTNDDGWSNDDRVRELLYGDNRAQLDEAWEGQYGISTHYYPDEDTRHDPYPTNPDDIDD